MSIILIGLLVVLVPAVLVAAVTDVVAIVRNIPGRISAMRTVAEINKTRAQYGFPPMDERLKNKIILGCVNGYILMYDTGESVRFIAPIDDEYCARCGAMVWYVGQGQFGCSEGHIS